VKVGLLSPLSCVGELAGPASVAHHFPRFHFICGTDFSVDPALWKLLASDASNDLSRRLSSAELLDMSRAHSCLHMFFS